MNFASKLLQVISFLPAVVTSIESCFGHKTGSDKKDAVMNFLQTALSMTDAVTGKEIVDEAQFRAGLSQIVTGTVACLNASAWAKNHAPSPATNTPSQGAVNATN